MQQFNLNEFLARQGVPPTHPVYALYERVKPLLGDSGWMAGGAVMSLIKGAKHTSDHDFFFKNRADLDFFKENLEADGAVVIRDSENAITLTYNEKIVQLISRRFYPDVQAIFDDFDFTISMFAVDADGNMYSEDMSLYDLANKEIRIKQVNSLGHTFKRLIKYGSKGYTIHKDTYVYLIAAMSTMDASDPEVVTNLEITGATPLWIDEQVPMVTTRNVASVEGGQIGVRTDLSLSRAAIQAINQVQQGGESNYDDGSSVTIPLTTT